MIQPDAETFRANVMSTYNVIEAATKLGVRKIVIASSETTYGVCFAEGDKDYACFPLEEDYDVDPMDSYGLSKVVNEQTAHAFAMRTGRTSTRCGSATSSSPTSTTASRRFLANPPSRKRNAWSYIDARDLGQIVRLASKRTGSASRCSTPSTTRSRRSSRRPSSWRSYSPGRPDHAPARRIRGAALEPQERARCWASASSTTGGST